MKPATVTFACVFAGGVVGTLLRWGVIEATALLGLSVAVHLLVVNIVGAFGLGWFIGRTRGRGTGHPYLVAFVAAGLLGSFTTFSGFTVEIVEQASGVDPLAGPVFASVSIAAGLSVAVVGRAVAR